MAVALTYCWWSVRVDKGFIVYQYLYFHVELQELSHFYTILPDGDELRAYFLTHSDTIS